jgi:hypothetical protein
VPVCLLLGAPPTGGTHLESNAPPGPSYSARVTACLLRQPLPLSATGSPSGSVDQWWKVLPRRSRDQTQATRGDNDPPQGQLACPVRRPPKLEATKRTPSRPPLTTTPMSRSNSETPQAAPGSPTVCEGLDVEQSRLHVLEPTFFANGAEVGGVRERALGSPTRPLAHRGAWRRRAGRGGSAPPLLFLFLLRISHFGFAICHLLFLSEVRSATLPPS